MIILQDTMPRLRNFTKDIDAWTWLYCHDSQKCGVGRKLDPPGRPHTRCRLLRLILLTRSVHGRISLAGDLHLYVAIHQRPTCQQAISTFTSGHRSFFSDCFPLLYHDDGKLDDHDHPRRLPKTTGLISAVDVYYQGFPIFSRVLASKTVSGWFLSSPFLVDLLEPKEPVQTWVQHGGAQNDVWLKQVEENLTLSWIMIDPSLKRAMNLSSQRAASVQGHWLTGEVEVKFASVMAGGGRHGSMKEYTHCLIVVACGGKEGGQVEMREVRVGMEDMEGRKLRGKDSLVILQRAMERGKRRRGKSGKEGKERFEGFLERKRVWKDKKESKERALDMLCQNVVLSLYFWPFCLSFCLERRKLVNELQFDC